MLLLLWNKRLTLHSKERQQCWGPPEVPPQAGRGGVVETCHVADLSILPVEVETYDRHWIFRDNLEFGD